jgi:hypothetical protein
MRVTHRSQLYPGLICWCKNEDIRNVFRIGDKVNNVNMWDYSTSPQPTPNKLCQHYTVQSLESEHLGNSELAGEGHSWWIQIESLVDSPVTSPEPVCGSISTPVPGELPMYTYIITAFVNIPATKDTPATSRTLIKGEIRNSTTPLNRNELIIEAGTYLNEGEDAKNLVVQTYTLPMSTI